MTRIEYAKVLWDQLMARKGELSTAAWNLDRSFHNIRLAEVGASGIQHRVIEDEEFLKAELEERIAEAEKVLWPLDKTVRLRQVA